MYFRDIAARNEARFLEDFANQTAEALRADILAQVWRNSAILTAKYRQLKLAFVFMACALLPWAVSLATFSLAKQGLHIIVKQ